MTLDLRPAYEKVIPSMVALRRDIHSHPELSFEEERTAGIVADGLRELGLEVKTGVGGTGVTGLLRAGSGGRTLLIRADMDALPVEEDNDADYCSRELGKMHA